MASQIGIENQHVCHFMPATRVPDCSTMVRDNPHSDHIALRGAQGATFLIIVNDHENSSTSGSTAWVAACFTSAGGCTTQKISFRYRVISASDTQGIVGEAYSISFGGTSNRVYELEVDAANLAEVSTGGWEYVQLLVSHHALTSGLSGTGIVAPGISMHGAYVAILHGLRHKRSVLGTQMT